MKTRAITTLLLAGLFAAATAGCNDQTNDQTSSQGSTSTAPAAAAALPQGLLLTEPPADVKELAAGIDAAGDGDQITIRGKVGGQLDPFVPGRAVMVLVDTSVPDCSSKGDDHCPTPWDYCCEPADQMAKNAVTVQVDDSEGKVLRAELRDAGGIAPLREVIVQGKLSKNESARAVHATGIYVVPKPQS